MVFGFFSKDRALKRAMEKVGNKLVQSPDRYAAMEKLREHGTDDALYALCRRFSLNSLKMVEDLEEKQWVVEVLVAKGETAVPALRRYMKSSPHVAYPLRILGHLTDKALILEVIDEVLSDEEPGYTRDPEKRIEVIKWLSEWEVGTSDEIATRVIPYLEDFDETVRFAAIEALSNHMTPAAVEALIAAMLRPEEESRRLKGRIATALADTGVDLKTHKEAVSALLGDALSDFKLHRDKLVPKQR
jgi:HEAT repeat protein